MNHKLNTLLKKAKKIEINDQTKIVIMSDCHRGSGDADDNFVKNQNIFDAALLYYYAKGFTFVELGDGDDMWEVSDYHDIIKEHIDTFKQLKKFHQDQRLIMIYGNHDQMKKSPKVMEKYFYHYYNKLNKQEEDLLNQLVAYESLVLTYQNHPILLIHGHQIDFLNSNLWYLSRFLVRYVWRNLERIGIKDPTSAAKNYRVSKKLEKKFEKWSKETNTILIAGHTHRPIYPKVGESLYFNDGSCVHPNGITCIEIQDGHITLVKWSYKVTDDEFIRVKREVIEGSEPIIQFFLAN